MNVDPRLDADIHSAENCKLVAYKDTKGIWTIGWGHALEDGKDHTGQIWTQQMADAVLDSDIAYAQAEALKLFEWQALDTPCRQNAFVELLFNMGLSTWKTFLGTRAAIERQDWHSVHDHLLASEWAAEVHATRATRIANYFLSGAYPNAVQQG
jgi:GH24 family phage-related lysozyme (muramidase)